jgi:chorismate mutase
MVFIERWQLWLPALLFLLANVGVFSVYRLAYAGRIQALDDRVRVLDGERAKAESRRQELEAARAAAARSQSDIETLYRDRFSTERQRLTRMIAEVKGLAQKAGLDPNRISYPVEEIEAYGLVKKSVVFTVGGTYPQLRQLINFLELSSSFLTLEGVRLSGDSQQPGQLRIDLNISTLFAADPQAGATTAPPAAGRAPAGEI